MTTLYGSNPAFQSWTGNYRVRSAVVELQHCCVCCDTQISLTGQVRANRESCNARLRVTLPMCKNFSANFKNKDWRRLGDNGVFPWLVVIPVLWLS